MNKHKTELTKQNVQEILINNNKVLFENKYIINFLKKRSIKTFFCIYMLPDQEYLYEIVINGGVILNLEFNTQTKEVLCTSEVRITDYLDTINNGQEKNSYY